MNIIIAGAGTVGYSLAQGLSFKHNVIIVDKDIQKLNKIEENLDILTLLGNSEDPKTYQHLNLNEIDLFIAVTDSDEANLLSTLIVEDAVTVTKKIIRLKNDYFAKSSIFEKLNIDEHIFPDSLMAEKVRSLFDFPKANNVKNFNQCPQKLISVKIHYADERQYRIDDICDENVVAVGIERKKEFIIPDAFTILEERDLVYLFGDANTIRKLSHTLDSKMPSSIKNIVIFGANPSAQNIAKGLLENQLSIKMIEKNREYCKEASEILQDNVTIINAPFEEHKLFESEGLKNADMIIAATENDEKNIVKCIEAREFGIEKVVAINNDKEYYSLMHQLGIVVVRGAKVGAHYAILEKITSSNIVNVRHFCGGAAVMFVRKIYPDSALIGKEITPLDKKDTLFYLIRQNTIYNKAELSPLEEGDVIVLFGKTEDEESIQKWIYSL
jgi:trk system potassium uptake protein TrkA